MASLIVISGPSGVGKTTLCNSLLNLSNSKLKRSISHTTRAMRPGEIHGVDYYFVSKENFRLMLKNSGFIEYTEYLNNFYGTSKEFLNYALQKNEDVMLILDHVGAKSIKQMYPANAHLIFCSPPSIKALKVRLQKRKSSTSEEIKERLCMAQECIATKDEYDHFVINEKLEDTVYRLCVLVNSISCKSIFEI
jgi:guanylate kinase